MGRSSKEKAFLPRMLRAVDISWKEKQEVRQAEISGIRDISSLIYRGHMMSPFHSCWPTLEMSKDGRRSKPGAALSNSSPWRRWDPQSSEQWDEAPPVWTQLSWRLRYPGASVARGEMKMGSNESTTSSKASEVIVLNKTNSWWFCSRKRHVTC